ncbi:Dimeric dUTPase, all-alpha-NTP-PPase (MazG) superfamily [Alteribacillus persepolensis]|uniref:Dimeric dUTPase, all-alpha-NTP-PPase (MazG) superfamily n=1 Tax=Alteribacillus persepolensis TaxID=568899 RepID=A0A1G8I936_9BACI|nr:dUTP diphosphatase [Alteribacillus persepolensis]SDI15393.1 Dimeric dUTPase, all-alpha-NTP-PPase (MazG) superfamily [Alteribacillus persepolensis]
MNLKPLFDKQRELDEKIVKQKELKGQELLNKKILALQVELGELANEWRGFKFWSDDQEPKKYQKKPAVERKFDGEYITSMETEYHGKYVYFVNGYRVTKETWDSLFDYETKVLEEYVDCLHFILSIGWEIHVGDDPEMDIVELEDCLRGERSESTDLILQFKYIYWLTSKIYSGYKQLFFAFVELGELLGFTWDEIEQAYMKKNATNHERQANGY